MKNMYEYNMYSELYHYGVKGQKHGVRQYQNKDGSLTPEGYIHYGYGHRRNVAKNFNKLSKQKSKASAKYNKYATGLATLDDYGSKIKAKYDLAKSNKDAGKAEKYKNKYDKIKAKYKEIYDKSQTHYKDYKNLSNKVEKEYNKIASNKSYDFKVSTKSTNAGLLKDVSYDSIKIKNLKKDGKSRYNQAKRSLKNKDMQTVSQTEIYYLGYMWYFNTTRRYSAPDIQNKYYKDSKLRHSEKIGKFLN